MLSSILHVLATLFPIYAILALGAWLRHAGFVTETVARGLNKIVFNVALPCFGVRAIATSPVSDGWEFASASLALGTVVVCALACLLAPVFGISRFSRPSFCQSAFRSNNAYIGIPAMQFAFQSRPDLGDAMSLALLTLAPCLLLYNVMAVAILTKTGDNVPFWRKLPAVVGGMLRNPLIIASLTGLALLAARLRFDWSLPPMADNTVKTLGAMATPGSILALGASLTPKILRANLRGAHWACLLKLVVAPLAGLLFCQLFGLPPLNRFVVVCYLSCPSAVASFVMAQAMDGDADIAGSTVALSTIYSVVSLSAVILLAMPPV